MITNINNCAYSHSPVHSSQELYFVITEQSARYLQGRVTVNSTAQLSWLSVTAVVEADLQLYTCHASSNVGEEKATTLVYGRYLKNRYNQYKKY